MSEVKKEIKEFIELTKKHLEKSSDCGGWCIRCALGNVLSLFNEKTGGISSIEALKQVATNNIHPVSKKDFLMKETRTYLKKFDENMVFRTKKEAIKFLDKALN